MSFLNQIIAKRLELKNTATKVTNVDGTQEQIEVSKVADKSYRNQTIKLEAKAYGFIIDTKPDLVPACILDYLYLGSQDAVMKANIDTYHLTDILSIGIETPTSDIVYVDGNVTANFIECLDLPETRLDPIIKQTNQIIKSVCEKNGRVLVHCNAGVSRSSSICIGYLILELKLTFDSAYSLVKSKRECIAPNNGFLKQLKGMEKIIS